MTEIPVTHDFLAILDHGSILQNDQGRKFKERFFKTNIEYPMLEQRNGLLSRSKILTSLVHPLVLQLFGITRSPTTQLPSVISNYLQITNIGNVLVLLPLNYHSVIWNYLQVNPSHTTQLPSVIWDYLQMIYPSHTTRLFGITSRLTPHIPLNYHSVIWNYLQMIYLPIPLNYHSVTISYLELPTKDLPSHTSWLSERT